MKLVTYGTPVGLTQSLLGRVALQPVVDMLDRRQTIRVVRNGHIESDLDGYVGLITSYQIVDLDAKTRRAIESLPHIHSVPHLDHLSDGDAVVMRPKQGYIRTLYRINSDFNSLFITERCNSDCVMCPQPPNPADDSYLIEENLQLIRLMNPATRYLGMTGGEPTLLKDDLIRIIAACKEYLPNTAIDLLTNGRMFLYDSYARKIADVRHSGLTVCIPLYSHIPSEHDYIVQAKDGFVQAMEGLYNLGRLRQRLEVRVVIHALNYRRLPKLAEYIYRNLPFVAHVTFMQMEIKGYVKKNLDELWIDPYDYQPELVEAVSYLDMVGMNVSVYNHQLCVLDKSLWPFARKSISDWKNIYLPECEVCSERERCGGLFSSAETVHSNHIRQFSLKNHHC